MTPENVCRTCGEPSRRIINPRLRRDQQVALAVHIRERRKASGFSLDEVNSWFGYATAIQHWEATGDALRVPTPEDWPLLKERLGLSDAFDELVYGESVTEYVYGSGVHAGLPKRTESLTGWESREDGANRRNVRGVDAGNMVANRFTFGFSDCGHDDFRPGVVLDPFSNSTAEVATALGRDAIGIELAFEE